MATPSFIAPEAIETPDQLDARSDLYSLGAVGYFLLTGKLLFEAESLGNWLQSQVQTMPLKPSVRIGRPIAPDLEALIMQCLAKDREQRPRSAKDLNDALAQCASASTWTALTAEQWWEANVQHPAAETQVWHQGDTLEIHPSPNMFRRPNRG
jgi:eukaryotic-like serine/threonine-protein kinase